MRSLRFSMRRRFRSRSSGLWRRVVSRKGTDVSEGFAASIYTASQPKRQLESSPPCRPQISQRFNSFRKSNVRKIRRFWYQFCTLDFAFQYSALTSARAATQVQRTLLAKSRRHTPQRGNNYVNSGAAMPAAHSHVSKLHKVSRQGQGFFYSTLRPYRLCGPPILLPNGNGIKRTGYALGPIRPPIQRKRVNATRICSVAHRASFQNVYRGQNIQDLFGGPPSLLSNRRKGQSTRDRFCGQLSLLPDGNSG